mmetsp:Transcript_13760/g.18429  ORF Transcript_13760/g.18429 Transcript_13760/m.18429 type:complete len:82 (+) Transcript_13760:886-1131(+)
MSYAGTLQQIRDPPKDKLAIAVATVPKYSGIGGNNPVTAWYQVKINGSNNVTIPPRRCPIDTIDFQLPTLEEGSPHKRHAK